MYLYTHMISPGDFFKTLQVSGEEDGARWANRCRWQWRSRPTNWLPDLQAALCTFMHSGSATDSRLHHSWCEVVKEIEPVVLVVLMLWLPRGLQLLLCPISVMDERCLISEAASPLSIYVGPWAAAGPWAQEKDLGDIIGKFSQRRWIFEVSCFFPGSDTSELCWSQIADVLFWVRWGKSGIDTAACFSRNIYQEPPALESILLTQ